MKYNKQVYHSFAMIGQFGISILVPIGIGSVAGYYLDQFFGTSFIFILLFFLGAIAGFRNIYRLAKETYDNKEEDSYEAIRKDAMSTGTKEAFSQKKDQKKRNKKGSGNQLK